MFLYLVRHGDARREEEDPLRALSEKGIHDIKRISAHISQLKLDVLRIYHSPKLRARQTAGILFDYLKPLKGVSEADGLAPLDDPYIWAARIEDSHDDTMLVGHLPHLARLSSLLLCGKAEKNIIAFSTAGIVCLDRDYSGIWRLAWILNPEIIPGEKEAGYACDSL